MVRPSTVTSYSICSAVILFMTLCHIYGVCRMPTRLPTDLASIQPSHQIDGCDPRTTSVRWPEPVHAYLDELVAAARSRTDRQELAAALICAAAYDQKTLARVLAAYRNNQVRTLQARLPSPPPRRPRSAAAGRPRAKSR